MNTAQSPACGVYAIHLRGTQEYYIGSSSNIRQRWMAHRSMLRAGTHHSRPLQRAWVRSGEESFEFIKLESVEPCPDAKQLAAALIAAEDAWMLKFSGQEAKPRFNVLAKAGEMRHLGTLRGRKQSAEHIANRLVDRIYVSPSAEMRAKISAALTGRRMSKEAAAKSAKTRTGMKGKPHTPETKAKMSVSATTRVRRPHTPETKAKLSQAATGRKLTPEHVAKTSAANIGRHPSMETRAKRSQSMKDTIARKRSVQADQSADLR
jgi:group I intron endonuclease